MLNHTRRIVPMLRAIAAPDRADVTVTVRRRVTKYRTIYLTELTTWELDGHGERRAPIAVTTLARWCPTTGELFVEDGDRLSGGFWDTGRETARANKAELDAIAAYGAEHGVTQYPGGIIRPTHYRFNG